MACEPLSRHGVAAECPIRIGDRALLVMYGGITAQVAWMAGERLATASVTSLEGDEGWVRSAACSIALLLDRRLQRDGARGEATAGDRPLR